MHLLELVRERVNRDVIGTILDAGVGFDLVDDAELARATILVRERWIGASRFRAVVVPDVHAMPGEPLAALERFADAEGAVIATGHAPVRPAGRRTPEERASFGSRVDALFARSRNRVAVIPH